MYKNLSPSAIGVFARQSELVEIALTHRFKGFEIEIVEVLRRRFFKLRKINGFTTTTHDIFV